MSGLGSSVKNAASGVANDALDPNDIYSPTGLDSANVDWFVNSGFENAAKLKGARIKNTRFGDTTAFQNIVDSEGNDISSLLDAYGGFLKQKGQAQDEYLKLKRQSPGRESTILVPNENMSIL